MDTIRQFDNTQTNKLAAIIAELHRLILWVYLDEQSIIDYWQQTSAFDTDVFREELLSNRDFVIMHPESLIVFRQIVTRDIEEPADELRKKIQDWNAQNPSRDNTMRVRFHIDFKLPSSLPALRKDDKAELRSVLSQIDGLITRIELAIFDIRKSFVFIPHIHRTSAKKEEASHTSASVIRIEFDGFLKDEYIILMPFLKEHYRDKKPKHYVPMLFALSQYMQSPLESQDQKKLHVAWGASFGDIGEYNALNTSIGNYSENKRGDREKQNINNCKMLIDRELERIHKSQ